MLRSRMGSFTSRPQIASCQEEDDGVIPPEGLAHEEFMEWVRRPLADLPSLLPRQYRHAPRKTNFKQRPDTPAATFRLLQWNILAQGS